MTGMDKFWKNHPVAPVLIGGLILHGVILFLVLPLIGASVAPNYGAGFADDQDKLAWSLASGNGYRFSPDTAETLLREPGYPFLLAATFSVFGYSLPAARLVNVLLAAGTAWLLVVMARKTNGALPVATVAVALYLVHPGTVIGEARGGFEALYTFCVALLTWRLSEAITSQDKWDYFLAGVVLGLTVLVRSSLIALPLFVLTWLLVVPGRDQTRSVAASKVGVLVLAMGVVISPWVIRNYVLVGSFVPTATVSGIAMHLGEYVCRNRDSGQGLEDMGNGARDERAVIARAAGYRFQDHYFPYFYSPQDEIAYSKALRQEAVAFYASSPGEFLKCASYNVRDFWFGGKRATITILNAFVQIPYLVLAAIGGVWLVRREGRENRGAQVVSIVLIVTYSMAVHAVTYAQARYSMPLIPLLALLGAFPVAQWWERTFGGRTVAGN
jgi:4-amino-4-deoxy-L-arabinose transferase-like glycosyltransferase